MKGGWSRFMGGVRSAVLDLSVGLLGSGILYSIH